MLASVDTRRFPAFLDVEGEMGVVGILTALAFVAADSAIGLCRPLLFGEAEGTASLSTPRLTMVFLAALGEGGRLVTGDDKGDEEAFENRADCVVPDEEAAEIGVAGESLLGSCRAGSVTLIGAGGVEICRFSASVIAGLS